jgi:hypothetical protein
MWNRGKREKNRDEPNWGTLYAYMEMSQRIPLYNYCILIETLKNKQQNSGIFIVLDGGKY